MKNYELDYLISPIISIEELKNIQEKINSLVQKEGGILDEVNSAIKKKLAYPVKKNQEAFLVNLNFHLASGGLLNNLEKELKEDKNILRYFILTKEKKVPEKALRVPRKKTIKQAKPKVELKEIEKKLEEILGE